MPQIEEERDNYRSYFDYYYKNCARGKLFASQIYLIDGTLILTEKDLAILESIDEEQIFFFQGIVQDFVEEADVEDGEHTLMFEVVESMSQEYFTKGFFASSVLWYERKTVDISPMDTYELFEIDILYALVNKGIAFKAVEPLIPQLFQYYDTVLRPWTASHRFFRTSWDSSIYRFLVQKGRA